MNRRKFIAATSVSVGVAGCLTGEESGEEDDETEDANLDDGGGDDRGDEGRGASDAGGQSDEDADGNGESENASDESDEGGEGDTGDGESGPSERTTSFDSCTRATVSGTFTDGDVAYASTTFYDEQGLVGDTILEDGVTFGEDVAAPFTGTVVFEIGDGADVSEGADEIVVTVPDYGATGTAITSLTTEREDYVAVSPTTRNPDADACLADLEAEAGGDGDADSESESNSDSGAEPSLSVSITDTNTPITGGEYLEITVEIANTGDAEATGTVDLVVGNDRATVASRSVTLGAGERRTVTDGYQTPAVRSDQEFPIRVETDDDADERTVLVYGTE